MENVIKENFLESRGIAYRASAIDPDRPTLLLIHGLSSSSSAWLPFEVLLSEYNLVIPDLRGHGFSKRYPRYRDYSMARYTEDIDALLHHLGVKDPIFVGYSFGAYIAVTFSHLHHRLKGAVLIAPLYKIERLLRVRVLRFFIHLLLPLISLLPMRQRKARVDYSKLQNLGDEDPRRMLRDIHATGIRSYLYCLDHICRFGRDRWWRNFTAPTLILHGPHDTVLPEWQVRELARDIPHARLLEYPEGSHMLVYNNSKEVAEDIKKFIESLENPAP